MTILIPPAGDPDPIQWCAACERHYATKKRPLCPSCLDDRAKEAKAS